jgi:uncharacterized membrane protein
MTIERFILIAIALLSIATVFYIPKNKYRLALISFFTFQFITWAGSVIVVQFGLFEFPVREFVRATKVGVIQNFLFVPMIFTWFILLFPHHSILPKKIFHYILFVSINVGFIYFISVYTDLEKFKKGTPLISALFLYIRILVYFIGCHIYISWFSKKDNLSPGAKNHASN